MPNDTKPEAQTNDYLALREELLGLQPPMSRDAASVVSAIMMVEARLAEVVDLIRKADGSDEGDDGNPDSGPVHLDRPDGDPVG